MEREVIWNARAGSNGRRSEESRPEKRGKDAHPPKGQGPDSTKWKFSENVLDIIRVVEVGILVITAFFVYLQAGQVEKQLALQSKELQLQSRELQLQSILTIKSSIQGVNKLFIDNPKFLALLPGAPDETEQPTLVDGSNARSQHKVLPGEKRFVAFMILNSLEKMYLMHSLDKGYLTGFNLLAKQYIQLDFVKAVWRRPGGTDGFSKGFVNCINSLLTESSSAACTATHSENVSTGKVASRAW